MISLSLLLTAATLVGAANLTGMKFIDFRMRGENEEDEPGWELRGREAVFEGTFIDITDLLLKLDKEDNGVTDVSSPHCRFDRGSNTGQSSSPVRAEDEDMVLEGKGYHFLVEQQKLHLHSEVRMVIKNQGDNIFPGQNNHGRPPPRDQEASEQAGVAPAAKQ